MSRTLLWQVPCPKQFREIKSLFGLWYYIIVHHFKTVETEYKQCIPVPQKHRDNKGIFSRLFLDQLVFFTFIQFRAQPTKWCHSLLRRIISPQLTIKIIPHRHVHRPNCSRKLPSWGIRGCGNLTAKTSHHRVYGVYMCTGMCATASMKNSKSTFGESILCLHYRF